MWVLLRRRYHCALAKHIGCMVLYCKRMVAEHDWAYMLVAVTHPTCWPAVRRGSERLLNDLSVYLAHRGHAVTVISSGDSLECSQPELVSATLLPRRLRRLSFRQLNGFHAFAYDLRNHLRGCNYDVMHCLNYHDAYGALVARRAGYGARRVVYQMTGIPVASYFRSIPLDRHMFLQVVKECDEIACLSHFAMDKLRSDFDRKGVLLPSPTEITPFVAAGAVTPRVQGRILFAGDLDEPRKGARLLARAFPAILARRDDASLHFTGRCSPATREAILAVLPPAARTRVTFHGVGSVRDLPALFAAADVVVNPAIWEALGNVLTEALAAGTPVVGCDHAGIPDIITDDRIGRLFSPGSERGAATDAEGLARAVLEALDLATHPETAALCQERARAFSWEALGPRYESLLSGTGQTRAAA